MNQNIQFKDKEKLYENTFFRIQNVSPQVIQHFVSAVVSLKLVLIHHVAVRYRPHLNMSGLNISCSQWGEHYLTLCILRLVFAYKWELRLLSCCSSTETFQIKIWAAEQLSGTTQGRTDRRSLNIKESWKTQKTMRWGGRGRQSHSAANGKKTAVQTRGSEVNRPQNLFGELAMDAKVLWSFFVVIYGCRCVSRFGLEWNNSTAVRRKCSDILKGNRESASLHQKLTARLQCFTVELPVKDSHSSFGNVCFQAVVLQVNTPVTSLLVLCCCLGHSSVHLSCNLVCDKPSNS